MRQEMESTFAAAVHDPMPAVLLGRRRETFDKDLVQVFNLLLATCLHQAGDQTSASLLSYAVDIALQGECPADFFSSWARRVSNVNKSYFGYLAEAMVETIPVFAGRELPLQVDAFVERLREIPGVEELRARETNGGFETWVVINDASEETRYAIYDAEWELMRRFPNTIFDCHLIDRHGMDLSSMVTFDAQTITVPVREH